MALLRMILVSPELWENRCQTPSEPPVKKVLKSKDHSFNKLTQVTRHKSASRSILENRKIKT